MSFDGDNEQYTKQIKLEQLSRLENQLQSFIDFFK